MHEALDMVYVLQSREDKVTVHCGSPFIHLVQSLNQLTNLSTSPFPAMVKHQNPAVHLASLGLRLDGAQYFHVVDVEQIFVDLIQVLHIF